MVNLGENSKLPQNGDENSARALLERLRTCEEEEVQQLVDDNFHYADLSFHLLRIMFREVTPESEWPKHLERLYRIITELLPPRMFEEEPVHQGTGTGRSIFDRKMVPKRQKALLTRVWIRFLSLDLPEDLMIRAMIGLGDGIINKMSNPQLLADVVMNSLDVDGELGLASLRAVFHLMVEHNVEYSDIYRRLYSLLGSPNLLESAHFIRFLDDLDVFMSSLHLPSSTVASFAKRLAILSLKTADVSQSKTLLSLITAIMRRHPTVQCLLHRDAKAKESEDPYNPETEEPEKSGALDSSLQELHILQKHWNPELSKMASDLLAKAPEVRVIERKPSQVFEAAAKRSKECRELALKNARSLRQSNSRIVQVGKQRKRKIDET